MHVRSRVPDRFAAKPGMGKAAGQGLAAGRLERVQFLCSGLAVGEDESGKVAEAGPLGIDAGGRRQSMPQPGRTLQKGSSCSIIVVGRDRSPGEPLLKRSSPESPRGTGAAH